MNFGWKFEFRSYLSCHNSKSSSKSEVTLTTIVATIITIDTAISITNQPWNQSSGNFCAKWFPTSPVCGQGHWSEQVWSKFPTYISPKNLEISLNPICKLWNACKLIQLFEYRRLCNPASLRPLHRFIIDRMGVVTMQDAVYTQGILGNGVFSGVFKIMYRVFFLNHSKLIGNLGRS